MIPAGPPARDSARLRVALSPLRRRAPRSSGVHAVARNGSGVRNGNAPRRLEKQGFLGPHYERACMSLFGGRLVLLCRLERSISF